MRRSQQGPLREKPPRAQSFQSFSSASLRPSRRADSSGSDVEVAGLDPNTVVLKVSPEPRFGTHYYFIADINLDDGPHWIPYATGPGRTPPHVSVRADVRPYEGILGRRIGGYAPGMLSERSVPTMTTTRLDESTPGATMLLR
jgi:hypothetical protein